MYIRSLRLLALLGLLMLSGLRLSASPKENLKIVPQKVSVTDYGLQPNHPEQNASALLTKLLGQLSKQAPYTTTIHFPAGDYHFYAADAPQKEVYISNHDQSQTPRSIGILLEGWQKLTIEGETGTNFYFHDRMLPIALINSSAISIRNVEIDFPNPQIAQVEIKENLGKGGIRFEPASWVNYRIEKNRLMTYGEHWENWPQAGMAFRPGYREILYRTSDLGVPLEGVQDLGYRQLLAPKWIDERLPAGTIVALRSYQRPNPAFFVDNSQNIRLEQVQVHYADGMGLLAQNSENIYLNAFSVCLRHSWADRPGLPYSDPRYFTTQADATHFVACKGVIDVRNGLFENMMDDAINIHGVYLRVKERIDDHTIRASYQHHQAWGFEWGKVGERVQFVSAQTQELVGGELSIQSIEPYGQKEVLGTKSFIIRLNQPLPQGAEASEQLCIENVSRTPNVNFVGNTIRHNRARGTLFNSAGKILVEDNKFQLISGAAILVCSDATGWYESGRTRNIIIRNNEFLDVLTSLFQFTEAVITFSPNIPKLSEQKRPFYGNGKNGILIENNLFETFDTPILHAKSVDGLIFRGNTLKETKSFPKFHWNQEQFSFKGCAHLQIEPLKVKQ